MTLKKIAPEMRAQDYQVDADPIEGSLGEVRTALIRPGRIFRPEKFLLAEVEHGSFVRVMRWIFGFLFRLARWELPRAAWTGNIVSKVSIRRGDGTEEVIASSIPTMYLGPGVHGDMFHVRVMHADEALALELRFARRSTVYVTNFGQAPVSNTEQGVS